MLFAVLSGGSHHELTAHPAVAFGARHPTIGRPSSHNRTGKSRSDRARNSNMGGRVRGNAFEDPVFIDRKAVRPLLAPHGNLHEVILHNFEGRGELIVACSDGEVASVRCVVLALDRSSGGAPWRDQNREVRGLRDSKPDLNKLAVGGRRSFLTGVLTGVPMVQGVRPNAMACTFPRKLTPCYSVESGGRPSRASLNLRVEGSIPSWLTIDSKRLIGRDGCPVGLRGPAGVRSEPLAAVDSLPELSAPMSDPNAVRGVVVSSRSTAFRPSAGGR